VLEQLVLVGENYFKGWTTIEMPAERKAQFTKLIVDQTYHVNDSISWMINLTHLCITAFRVEVSDSFFNDMHQLQVLKLAVHINGKFPNADEVYDCGKLTDAGVRILLDDNPNLREVNLSWFPLTDQSITYFTDYVGSHGLQSLILKSCDATGFSEAPAKVLVSSGMMNKLEKLQLCSRKFQLDLSINRNWIERE
jgi:hypothetical protein